MASPTIIVYLAPCGATNLFDIFFRLLLSLGVLKLQARKTLKFLHDDNSTRWKYTPASVRRNFLFIFNFICSVPSNLPSFLRISKLGRVFPIACICGHAHAQHVNKHTYTRKRTLSYAFTVHGHTHCLTKHYTGGVPFCLLLSA